MKSLWNCLELFILNFVLFEKYGFHGYSSGLKMTTVKQTMSDWPVSDRKMASHSNFKLRFCKRLKVDHLKWRNVALAGKRRKNDATPYSNFKLNFLKIISIYLQVFSFTFLIWEVWLPWLLIWFRIGHCKTRNVWLTGQWRINDVT